LTPLSLLLAENALDSAQKGLVAEATAPMIAALRFGGGPRARDIADAIGASLADQALIALEAQRHSDAAALAGLALSVAETDKMHYVLCMAFRREAPRAAAFHARRLDELATAEASALKMRALLVLNEALTKAPVEEAVPAWADLEERLVRLLSHLPHLEEAQALLADVQSRKARAGTEGALIGRDLFGAEKDMRASLGEAHRRAIDFALVQDQNFLAFAHCAALVRLDGQIDTDHDRKQRAIVPVSPVDLPPATAGSAETETDAWLGRMAVIAFISPSLPVLAPLLEQLWKRGEVTAFLAAVDLARPLPIALNNDWFTTQHAIQIADLVPRGAEWVPSSVERTEIELAACDGVLSYTDRILEHRPSLAGLQVARLAYLLQKGRYTRAFQEIADLVQKIHEDESFGKLYYASVNEYILYLNAPKRIKCYEKTVQYMLNRSATSLEDLEFLYFHCGSAGALGLARQVADRLGETRPHWKVVAHLQDFLNVAAQQPAAVFGRPRTGKHVIYGNLVCWGNAFIEKMAWSSLPSLMAPRNIPALVQDHDLVIDLITHRKDLEAIRSLPELQQLAQYCEIRIYCFPDVAGFDEWTRVLPYVVFGHAQHFTLLRAQLDKVDALIFSADVVYADGCFDFVARHVSKEPRALFYDGLNCSQTPLRERLAPYRVDSVLTIDAPTLARFAMQCLKPIAESSFFHKSGASTKTSAPSFIMRKEFGFRVYSFMQGLVYASAAALEGVVGFDHLTLEGRCSELLLDKLTPDQVIVRTSTDDILWVEMDDADRTSMIPHGTALVSHLDAVRNYFVGYARTLNRFTLFEMAVDCEVEGLTFGDVIDDETEAQFLADLRAMKASDPVFTELCAP